VPKPVIRCEQVGKRFCRSLGASLRYGLADSLRRGFRQPPPAEPRPDEFWALREISFEAGPGECLGIIGPNGAGKSTLLKLINGDHRPDHGFVARRGAVTSLIRLGAGLQPLLSGRENIQIRCAELGFNSVEIEDLLPRIAAFSGLEKSLDAPVKGYSDGMYARLEFSIATSAPMDILLIDEVLAVGDIAFQMLCLKRLDELKRAGTTLLFVSHSEMNVRAIADRCLLLFDGEMLALGGTDALFRRYYEATGFLDRALEPMGLAPEMPEDFSGTAHLTALAVAAGADARARTGEPLRLRLEYRCSAPVEGTSLVLQFWSPTGLLLAVHDTAQHGETLRLATQGEALLELPCLPLAAGRYRLAGGFRTDGRWLGYRAELLQLSVTQARHGAPEGLVMIPGRLGLGA